MHSSEINEALRAGGLRPSADVLPDETGMDFLVVAAIDDDGRRWIVRSARRSDAAAKLDAERRALDLIAGHLPVDVPRWRELSPSVVAYPRLEGEPAAVIDMSAGGYVWRFDEASPPALFLDSLAGALAALHSIDVAEAERAGLALRDVAVIRDTVARRIEHARSVLSVPAHVEKRWQRWLGDDTYWPTRLVPVHGDIHPAHLLVDASHRLTGILDWTEAHIGDAAVDFTILHATLGPETLDALLRLYAERGGAVSPRMREHVAETWAAYPTVIADFARTTGNDEPLGLAQVLVDAVAAER